MPDFEDVGYMEYPGDVQYQLSEDNVIAWNNLNHTDFDMEIVNINPEALDRLRAAIYREEEKTILQEMLDKADDEKDFVNQPWVSHPLRGGIYHYELERMGVDQLRVGYQYIVRLTVRNGREELQRVSVCTCEKKRDHYKDGTIYRIGQYEA